MAAPFAIKLLVFQEPQPGFWLIQLTQWATFLFHLTNTVFRNILDPSSLFRLYHQQDLQSKISIFPCCLILPSSHSHCLAHNIHKQWSPKDPMILGVASTINHRTHILALHFDNLHLCKAADLKTKGYLSFRQTTNDIPWQYPLHSCPAVIHDQIQQILSARVHFACLGDFNSFHCFEHWRQVEQIAKLG